MKRLHWLSLGLLLMSALLMGTASVTAQSDMATPSLDEQIAGNATSPMNSFGGTPQKPEVKDLYKNIYKTLKIDTERAALQKTAQSFQYSETEMMGIVHGDLKLLSMTQSGSRTYSQLLALYEKIIAAYEKNVADETLKQNLLLDTYPQEIFVNGDTGDSGFDVVYDLNILELLMFGDESSTSGGGAAGGALPSFPAGPAPSGSIGSSAPSSSVAPAPATASSSPAPASAAPPPASPGSSGSSVPATPIAPSSTPSAPSAPAPSALPTATDPTEIHDPLNPVACAADSELQSLFRDVVADDSTATPPDTTTPDSSAPPDSSLPIPAPSGGGGGDSSDVTPPTPSTPPISTPSRPPYLKSDPDGKPIIESPLVPRTSASWVDPPQPCNKIFCLKVKFTNRPGASYGETKNCVQCHVQYIIQSLREATSQSLTPGKVSGNLMEPATCKKSLFSGGVSLNFIPIAMPIKTPASSNLVSGVDLKKNFEDFANNVWGVDFAKSTDPDKAQGDQTKTSSGDALDAALRYQNTITATGTNAQTVYEEALATYDERVQEINRKFKESYAAARFNSATDMYQALRYEIDQMSFYFESFRAAIDLAQEVTEDRKNNLTPAS